MRPIERGTSPIKGDFKDYKDAFPELSSRLGPYCSYCERRMPTNLAVEHIQPKDDKLYPGLIGKWNNYLLGCVNCNSTKKNKDLVLADVLLPDRDNTAYAFGYANDGKITVNSGMSVTQQAMAKKALSIPGLDKPEDTAKDSKGEVVYIDRVGQRRQVWLIAEESKKDLALSKRIDPMKRQVVRTALANGYFSIWMQVFADDNEMRWLFINGFPGTAADCFDNSTGDPVSPRKKDPALGGSGKC
jgi:uncharacterized protein (TIGR02646 family)